MTEDSRPPRRDPVAEFQRWLMRSSARSVGRELKGQVSRTFGGGGQRSDIWETATTEPPAGEAPECAWCPVCRAARRFRESGPGLASHMAGAGDALLSVAQDTIAAFESSLSARPPTGHKSPAGIGWPAEPAPSQAPGARLTGGGTRTAPSGHAEPPSGHVEPPPSGHAEPPSVHAEPPPSGHAEPPRVETQTAGPGTGSAGAGTGSADGS